MRGLFAAAAVLMLAGCAGNEGVRSALTGQLEKVQDLAREDIVRAQEIAQADADPAGAACSAAILNRLDAVIAHGAGLPPAGVFSAFMKARQLRRKLDGGKDEAVHNACAPLVLDTATTLGKLGLQLAPGGGIAGDVAGKFLGR